MESKKVEVIMEGSNPTRRYKQIINKFQRFGREMRISPKANAMVCDPGFEVKFYDEVVNVCIGIGKDHTADLLMSKEAWEAFKDGEEISVTTVKEFKEGIK